MFTSSTYYYPSDYDKLIQRFQHKSDHQIKEDLTHHHQEILHVFDVLYQHERTSPYNLDSLPQVAKKMSLIDYKELEEKEYTVLQVIRCAEELLNKDHHSLIESAIVNSDFDEATYLIKHELISEHTHVAGESSAFAMACRHHQIKLANSLIDLTKNINEQDQNGQTLCTFSLVHLF
jgi:hypothetical protein